MATAKEFGIHIDAAEKRAGLPDHDVAVRCAAHPSAEPEDGFGMAGGGFGVYTFCPVCGCILSKSEVPE